MRNDSVADDNVADNSLSGAATMAAAISLTDTPRRPLTEKGRARAVRRVEQQAVAPSRAAKKSRELVDLSKVFFTKCRPATFDPGWFSTRDIDVYSDEDVADSGGKFSCQLSFNFSARYQSAKVQAAKLQRVSCSAAAIDLDADTVAHTISSTNFRDLSPSRIHGAGFGR